MSTSSVTSRAQAPSVTSQPLCPSASSAPAGEYLPRRLERIDVALVWLFGLSMLLIGLGRSRVLTYHEVVFAQPAREMLATGDFVIPRISGVPFLDKPPGNTWLIAASLGLFQSEAEWVARLPSVLSVVITAWLIGSLAANWFGRRLGVLTSLVYLTSVHATLQGRLAEADTALALFNTAAMVVYARSQVGPQEERWQSGWAPVLFYALLGYCFLIKSLIGPVLVGASCGLFILAQGDLRRAKFFFNPWGLLTFAAIVGAWLFAAYSKYPPMVEWMTAHTFGRFQGTMGVNDPWWSYFYSIPLMLLPWFPLVLVGVWHCVRRGWWHDARWQWLACWFLGGMAILAASSFKSKHYPIPLFAPLAVFAAVGMWQHLAWRFRTVRLRSVAWATLAVLGCTLAAVVVMKLGVRRADYIAGVIAVIGLGSLAIVYFEARRQITAQLASLFAVAWLVSVGAYTLVVPAYDSYRPQAELAQRVSHVLPKGERLYMLELPDSQIGYYLPLNIDREDHFSRFPYRDEVRQADRIYGLAPHWVCDLLSRQGEVERLDQCATVHKLLTEKDRMTFFAYKPHRSAEQSPR